MNTQSHHIYNDNFDLRVINLTQIKLATDEDKQFQIDYWAALFKSETWEEIARQDEEIALLKQRITELESKQNGF